MASLADIRRAAAARYAQVPKDERPTLRKCDDCKKPLYDDKVCLASGRYHIVDEKNTLRIGTSVIGDNRKVVEGKELMAAFEANRIRWQEARTKKVRLDRDSADIFQSFVVSRNWQLMRYGIMYGTYDEKEKIVSVHTIYEPSQHGDAAVFYPEKTPCEGEKAADVIAKALGMTRLGIICTHPPRDKGVVPLSSTELIASAKEQSRFGDHCVIVTVGPATDHSNQIIADAWQATEQAVKLYRAGMIDVCGQSQQYVECKEELEVVLGKTEEELLEEQRTGKKKPAKTMEPSHFVDTKWMTGYIAIESFVSNIVTNRFARYDRPGELPLTIRNISAFLSAPNRASLPFAEKLCDFHLLAFLALSKTFDINSDIPAIIMNVLIVRQGKEAANVALFEGAKDALANFEMLLNAVMKASAGQR